MGHTEGLELHPFDAAARGMLTLEASLSSGDCPDNTRARSLFMVDRATGRIINDSRPPRPQPRFSTRQIVQALKDEAFPGVAQPDDPPRRRPCGEPDRHYRLADAGTATNARYFSMQPTMRWRPSRRAGTSSELTRPNGGTDRRGRTGGGVGAGISPAAGPVKHRQPV